MKRVLILSIVVALVAASSPVAAADASANNRHLIYIYPHSGGFSLKYDGANESTNVACEPNRSILPIGAPNYQAIVSTLITAFAGSYLVDVVFDDTTRGSCEMTINRVLVKKQ